MDFDHLLYETDGPRGHNHPEPPGKDQRAERTAVARIRNGDVALYKAYGDGNPDDLFTKSSLSHRQMLIPLDL